MTYLIDTDVLIDFFKHKEPEKSLIAKLSQQARLVLSALTLAELRTGWTEKQASFLLPRLTALFEVIPVSAEIAEQAGAWRQAYRVKGVSLGTVDTVIAATAFMYDAVLLTNNAKDYPMPEITLYNRKKAA